MGGLFEGKSVRSVRTPWDFSAGARMAQPFGKPVVAAVRHRRWRFVVNSYRDHLDSPTIGGA